MRVDHIFQELYPTYVDAKCPKITDFECYRKLVRAYKTKCAAPTGEGGDQGLIVDEYTLKWFKTFVSYCESEHGSLDAEVQRIANTCSH
jgi:hypothetical protein